MIYSARLLAHFEQPRNAGTFAPGTAGVATGTAGAPPGGVVRLQIRVEQGRIVETRFKAFGDPAVIACASLAGERLAGCTPEQALNLGNAELAEALALPAGKIQAAVLVETAIRAALGDYRGGADS